MPLLTGQVFHVTSVGALGEILASGSIMSNGDGRLGFTFPQSKNSYGRQQGYVCLFDLREVEEDDLRDSLPKFYFPKPTAADPAFLFLRESQWHKVIPWTEAPTGAMVVPYLEAWYPTDIPLQELSHALSLTVAEDDADSAFRGAMRGLREDVADIHSSGLVQISGRTMDEVRERAQEWTRVAREGGLEIDRDWDEALVTVTEKGLSIGVSASRPHGRRNLER